MLLAALVDLGFPLNRLRGILCQLGLRGFGLDTQRVWRTEEQATRLILSIGRRVRFQTPREMQTCLKRSKLPGSIQVQAARMIDRLARVESQIHRVLMSGVHFHQLAGADTLAALAGFCAALKELKVKEIFLSPVPIGAWHRGHDGRWRRAEGPVVQRLLRGLCVVRRLHRFEWTTPTAALLLSHFGSARAVPPMRVMRIGRAVGRAAVPEGSGLLRLLLGVPMQMRAST